MKSIVRLLAAALLAAPCWAAAQGMVVFGTSLSDPGNARAVLGEANTPPDWTGDQMFLVPDRPYARGGGHFSNGATWVEQLARSIGEAKSAKPAFAPGGGTNFAFGGARARPSGDSPDLGEQVGLFLKSSGGKAPGNALYVIEMGGNDMRDAVEAFATGRDGAPILREALGAIGQNVTDLYNAGARRFLIWNMPNIGVTPAIAQVPPLAGLANQLAVEFNRNLTELVLEPLSQAPGVQLGVVDAYRKLNEVVASPATFGLDNVKQACLRLSPPYACPQPQHYLFWDGIHPTSAGHAILAHEAARVLRR
jgi:phospholipase/lecithinase/hemolysin